MTFKERLRTEIEYKGMSVKEIASAAGISNNTLLSYIDSRGYLPNVETAVKIASVLGVSVEYLVTGKTPSGTAKDIAIADKDFYELNQVFSKLSKNNKKLLIKIALLLN